MKIQTFPRPAGAFTIIESLLMIAALLVFSVVVYSVYKKDHLTPAANAVSAPSPSSAAP